MIGQIHHLELPSALLQRAFWLYVWKIVLPSGGGTVHYVGMTGDTGAGTAQSAMNRVSAHLGRNVKSNALRRYLKSKREVELEDCQALDLFAFGPVYRSPEKADYATQRGKVAAIEKHLWAQMEAARYVMLNAQPAARAKLDRPRWEDVYSAFREHFHDLKSD